MWCKNSIEMTVTREHTTSGFHGMCMHVACHEHATAKICLFFKDDPLFGVFLAQVNCCQKHATEFMELTTQKERCAS